MTINVGNLNGLEYRKVNVSSGSIHTASGRLNDLKLNKRQAKKHQAVKVDEELRYAIVQRNRETEELPIELLGKLDEKILEVVDDYLHKYPGTKPPRIA